MPINFKPKAKDTKTILKMVDLPWQALPSDLQIELGSNELILTLDGHSTTVEVPSGVMLAISKGQMGPASKKLVAGAIKTAVAQLGPQGVPVTAEDTDDGLVINVAADDVEEVLPTFSSKALDMLNEIEQSVSTDMKAYVEGDVEATLAIEAAIEKLDAEVAQSAVAFGTFPEHQIKKADTVPLLSATMLYQPVDGTSSRYYAVALSSNLRVAARYDAGTLSCRVEGAAFDKFKDHIKAAGFDIKSNTYASVHLACNHDDVLAAKALGALIVGLNIQFTTPAPNLKVFAGA